MNSVGSHGAAVKVDVYPFAINFAPNARLGHGDTFEITFGLALDQAHVGDHSHVSRDVNHLA
jgi:hypothetical protein